VIYYLSHNDTIHGTLHLTCNPWYPPLNTQPMISTTKHANDSICHRTSNPWYPPPNKQLMVSASEHTSRDICHRTHMISSLSSFQTLAIYPTFISNSFAYLQFIRLHPSPSKSESCRGAVASPPWQPPTRMVCPWIHHDGGYHLHHLSSRIWFHLIYTKHL
jgi:hypothetical protein